MQRIVLWSFILFALTCAKDVKILDKDSSSSLSPTETSQEVKEFKKVKFVYDLDFDFLFDNLEDSQSYTPT